MATSKKKPKAFTFTCRGETRRRLQELAEGCGVSQAELLRALIGMKWKEFQAEKPEEAARMEEQLKRRLRESSQHA